MAKKEEYICPSKLKYNCEGYDEYIQVVCSQICKGVKPSSWEPEMRASIPGEFIRDCLLVAGNELAASTLSLPLADEGVYDYRKRTAGDKFWGMIDVEDDGFEFKDQDFLVWAWSEDGNALPAKEEVLQDGNVTGGFLIKASGDYPTVWLSHDPSVPGGVYPMETCGSVLRTFENMKGKVAWVIRFRGS